MFQLFRVILLSFSVILLSFSIRIVFNRSKLRKNIIAHFLSERRFITLVLMRSETKTKINYTLALCLFHKTGTKI